MGLGYSLEHRVLDTKKKKSIKNYVTAKDTDVLHVKGPMM